MDNIKMLVLSRGSLVNGFSKPICIAKNMYDIMLYLEKASAKRMKIDRVLSNTVSVYTFDNEEYYVTEVDNISELIHDTCDIVTKESVDLIHLPTSSLRELVNAIPALREQGHGGVADFLELVRSNLVKLI